MLEKTDGNTAVAYYKLRLLRGQLTKQQIRTIKGQIKAGDARGALIGMERMVGRKRGA